MTTIWTKQLYFGLRIFLLLGTVVVPCLAISDNPVLKYLDDFENYGKKSKFLRVKLEMKFRLHSQGDWKSENDRIKKLIVDQIPKWGELKDPVLGYKYAVCVENLNHSVFGENRQSAYYNASDYMAVGEYPKDIEFSYMLFKMSTFYSPKPEFIPYLERFRKFAGSDYFFKSCEITVLRSSSDPKIRLKAAELGEKARKLYPNDLKIATDYAYALDRMARLQDKKFAGPAIEAWKYILNMSIDDAFRRYVAGNNIPKLEKIAAGTHKFVNGILVEIEKD